MEKTVSKKLVIITGASKGIGFATANKFVSEGHEVINLSRTNCELEGVTNFNVDLGGKENLQHALDAKIKPAIKQHNLPVSLVHNACYYENDTYETLEYDRFLDVLKVNILAVQLLNQNIIPIMQTSSSILYVGSTLSEKASRTCLSYTTSKHAMAGIMKATAQDLAGKNISSTMICPGFTNTEMLREHLQGNLDFAKKKALFGRLVEPEEIAELIYFCSNNPSVNGSVIHANLGESD